MMRLKLYLKNSIKPALLFNLILIFSLFLSGCDSSIKPTYKEEDIPFLVKKICKEEYKLDVITKRNPTALWIYAPLQKILHNEYGIKEGKFFDEEIMEKMRNILTTVGRVLISSDNAPEFFALLASDINIGIDYTIISSVLDLKKSYAGFIPWTEANRRYVVRLKENSEAINDKTGQHLIAEKIVLPDFLAEQIAGRIGSHFQGEALKGSFKVDKVDGVFEIDRFIFEYSINQTQALKNKIDLQNEIIKIAAYCIKTYEFKDFSAVELKDLFTNEETVVGKDFIWSSPVNERF
ncbi:MAG: hypothetical protein ABIH27_06090 [Candidatus Omnitrophota bacterium]